MSASKKPLVLHKRAPSAVRKKPSSAPRKRNSGKRGKKTRSLFGNRPAWMWWLIGVVTVLVYIAGTWYFFVGPDSLSWKARYGVPIYPDGYEVHGIDISHYQQTVDWEVLRNASINHSPVRFVFIKATEGVSIIDEHFKDNFHQARENDLVRGAYHFYTPDVDARLQAEFFLKQVCLEPGDLPPVLDVEKKGDLSTEELQAAVRTWLRVVEQAVGVKPIIYTGYKFKLRYLNTPEFDAYPYWIAHYYVEKLRYEGAWHFWQHTDCGRVNGIKGDVDCNIFNGSVDELMALTIPTPPGELTDSVVGSRPTQCP